MLLIPILLLLKLVLIELQVLVTLDDFLFQKVYFLQQALLLLLPAVLVLLNLLHSVLYFSLQISSGLLALLKQSILQLQID
jgi:hypothetical protein